MSYPISERISEIFRAAFLEHPQRLSDPAIALQSARETASAAIPTTVVGEFDDEHLSFWETGEAANFDADTELMLDR